VHCDSVVSWSDCCLFDIHCVEVRIDRVLFYGLLCAAPYKGSHTANELAC
jgi:hypothetical protein